MAKDIVIRPDVEVRSDAGGLVDEELSKLQGAAKNDLSAQKPAQEESAQTQSRRGSFKMSDAARAEAETETVAEAPVVKSETSKPSRRGSFKMSDAARSEAASEAQSDAEAAGLAPSVEPQGQDVQAAAAEQPAPAEQQSATPPAPPAPPEPIEPFPEIDYSSYAEPYKGEGISARGKKGFASQTRKRIRSLLKGMPEADVDRAKALSEKSIVSSNRRRSRPDAPSASDRYSKDKLEKSAKRSSIWSNKGAHGNVTIYDKLTTSSRLNPNENSFGWHNYMEMVNAPGNGFIERMEKVTQLDRETLTDPTKIKVINKALRDAIERDPDGALFSFEKHPLTGTGDNLSVYLQLHPGRGIKCHPAISKMMNADFDGDGAKINMRFKNSEGLRMVSELFSGTGHREMIDEDYFPLPKATEDNAKAIAKRFNATPKQRARIVKALELRDFNLLGQAIMDIAENAKNSQAKINWNAGEMIGRMYRLGKIEAGEEVQFVRPPLMVESPIDRKELTSVPDEVIADWVEKSLLPTAGLAVNVIELETMLRSNISWVPGKSHEFRVIANIAKYARKSDKVVLDDDGYATIKGEEGIRDLAFALADEVYARAMSKQTNEDQAMKAQKMILRNNIIFFDVNGNESELNPRFFRTQDGMVDIEGFTAELIRRYEYWAAVVDSANVKVYMDMSVEQKRKWAVYEGKYDTSAIGKMFVNVFGHMTLDSLFHYCGFNDSIIPGWSRYKDMRIEDFIVSNPYNMSSCAKDPYTGETIKKGQGPYNGPLKWDVWFCGRNMYKKQEELLPNETKRVRPQRKDDDKKTYREVPLDGPVHPRDLFYIIADQKNLKAGEFSRDFNKALNEASKAILSIRPRIVRNLATSPDDADYADAILFAIKLLAPETFHHFGLYGTRDWLETDLGLKILKCNNADELKNCIYMAEYEMKVSHARDALAKLTEVDKTDPKRKGEWERLANEYASIIDALSSSSTVWSILANDFADLGRTWSSVVSQAMDCQAVKGSDGKMNYRKHVMAPNGQVHFMYLNGMHIWQNADRWESFHDFMADEAVSAKDKEHAIADAAKLMYGTQMAEMHVAYQLSRDKSSMFTESRYRDREGFSDLLVNIRQSYDSIQNAMKKNREYQKEAEEQLEKIAPTRQEQERLINNFLDELRDGRSLVQVHTGTAAAMIASSLDAYYPDSEKGKNANVLSAAASAVALQKNGMLASDWTIINDIRYGKIDYDTLMKNPTVLVYILASRQEFEVYTGNGSYPISYDILCPNGIVPFLTKNPRVFLAFSEQIANPIDDADGGSAILQSRTTVSQTILDSEDELTKALNVLDNHPGFYAMVAGSVNAKGLSSRSAVTVYESAIKNVIKQLAIIARGSNVNDRFYDGHINLSFGERPESVSEKDWNQKVDRINQHARDYAWELRNHLSSLELDRLAEATFEDEVRGGGKEGNVVTFFINEETMRAADRCEYQVYQSLNAVSVGVNGSMTQEAVPAGVFYSVETEEDCLVQATPITVGEIRANMKKYGDVQTADGTFIKNIDIIDLAESAPGTVLYIRPPHKCQAPGKTCHHCTPWDGSSSRSDRTPVHPLACFFQLVRTDSSEALALKAGKTGYSDPDDLVGDRISRNCILDEICGRSTEYRTSKEARDKIIEAYETGGIEAAREAMADDLMEVCSNMGYPMQEGDGIVLKGMSYMQMLGVAKTMVVEDLLDGGVKILSLRQIERTIMSKMDEKDLSVESDTELAQIFSGYVDELAMEEMDRTIPDRMNNVKVAPRFFNLRYNERVMASAPERNYEQSMSMIKDRAMSPIYDIAYLRSVEWKMKRYLKKNGEYWKNLDMMNYGEREIKKKIVKVHQLSEDFTIYGYWLGGAPREVYKGGLKWSRMLPGMASAIFVTGTTPVGASGIKQIVEQARDIGVTVAFDAAFIDEYKESFEGNISENLVYSAKYDCWMLPFFDMRLNGESGQVRAGSMSVGTKRIDPRRLVRMVLETSHEHDLGDSSMVRTKNFTDRFKARTGGTHATTFSDCFATLLNAPGLENAKPKFRLLSPEEGRLAAAGGAANLPTIDLGVHDSDRAVEYFESGYERFLMKLKTQSDEDMRKDVMAGDIVAFAEMSWQGEDGQVYIALSPIRPFDRAEGRSAPETYNISNISVDYSTAEVLVEYVINRSFKDGDFFKAFEGSAAANKFICDLYDQRPHRLVNSSMVDVFTKAESTLNRRGENLKKDCISTMIYEAKTSPEFGYNIAESEIAFPNNPELKQICLERPLSNEEWETLRDEKGVMRFYADDGSYETRRMNSLCNKIYRSCQAAGINPSIIFTSRFTLGSHNLHTIYHAVLEGTEDFQADFMSWFNFMMPTICPSDPLDTGDEYMFTRNPEDGALEVAVECWNPDGKSTYWTRQHMITSEMFFSDDVSVTQRASIGESTGSPYAAYNMMLSGKRQDMDVIRNMCAWALSRYTGEIDVSPYVFSPDYESLLDNFAREEFNMDTEGNLLDAPMQEEPKKEKPKPQKTKAPSAKKETKKKNTFTEYIDLSLEEEEELVRWELKERFGDKDPALLGYTENYVKIKAKALAYSRMAEHLLDIDPSPENAKKLVKAGDNLQRELESIFGHNRYNAAHDAFDLIVKTRYKAQQIQKD